MARDSLNPGSGTTTDALASLLRGEIAAVETYVVAIRMAGEATALADSLRGLRDRHVEAVRILRGLVRENGDEGPVSSGAWGAFAKAVEGAAALLGNAAAIRALREGEDFGTRTYERALAREDLDPKVRYALEHALLPVQRTNAREVRRMVPGTN